MTRPAESPQPTAAPPVRLVHCICSGCHPHAASFPLTRPATALCGHVVSINAHLWTGTETTCVVCDDLEPTHICPPKES